MGWLGFVIVFCIVVYYLFAQAGAKDTGEGKPGRKTGTDTPGADGAPLGVPADSLAYLKTQWLAAERERDSGTLINFPSWFFVAVTERQLKRLGKDAAKVPGRMLTKGTASDLIGLSEPVGDGDAEKLTFFKVPKKGLNQTIAAYEVKRMMSDPEKASAWNARPAEAMQKEFLKFFDMAVPKGLTQVGAVKLIEDFRKSASDTLNAMLAEWDAFQSLVEQLDDKETREDYGLKKVSLPAIREAVAALKAEGHSLPEVEGDLDLFTEKLTELRPELERSES